MTIRPEFDTKYTIGQRIGIIAMAVAFIVFVWMLGGCQKCENCHVRMITTATDLKGYGCHYNNATVDMAPNKYCGQELKNIQDAQPSTEIIYDQIMLTDSNGTYYIEDSTCRIEIWSGVICQ